MGLSMRKVYAYAAVVIAAGMGIFSCTKPLDTAVSYSVSVTGTVLRKNLLPLDSVTVITLDPIRRDTVKNADGSFTISFSSAEPSAVTTTVTFSRPRFYDTTLTITYSSTITTVKLQAIVMRAINPAEDVIVTGLPSLRPVSIVYIGSSEKSLSINGSGGVDVTSLTFEARDSLGNPVDLVNKVVMKFRFIIRPDLLTAFNRDTISTNSAGRATVILAAGQRAGIVQAQALALVVKSNGVNDTIKSPLASLPIYGGAADSSHFSIGTTKYNVPGAVKFNLRAPITALVGDKFGNPAQPGTVVYFTTTGGVIQSSASSTADGLVAVDLITGNPIPPSGFAVITAQIASGTPNGAIAVGNGTGLSGIALSKKGLGDEGIPQPLKSYVASTVEGSQPASTKSIFSRSMNILLSGATTISTADTAFVITTGSERKIDFFVGDANGNPLAEGTTVKVTGAGLDTSGVALSGDVDKLIPDTQDKAYTHYSILLTDKRVTNLFTGKNINITIEVNSPNGNTKKSLNGYLPPAGSDSATAGYPDTTHTTVTTDKVNYAWYGSGGQPIGKVVVQLGDKFGHPVVLTQVTFATTAGRISGSMQTDVNGRAEASLLGGFPLPPNGIGTVTVSAVGSGKAIISKSVSFVYGYLPLISVADTNFVVIPGADKKINFTVADLYGNPLPQGTTIRVSGIGLDTGGVVLSGDVSTILPDTKDKVYTQYSVLVADKRTTNRTYGKQIDLTIDVVSPTGTLKKAIKGYLGPAGSDTSKVGIPDLAHFTLFTDKTNYPWYGANGQPIGTVVVQLGDKYGNPIPLTPVTFTTNAGRITGSVTTDNNGRAEASLLGGLPVPADGIGRVTVSTPSGSAPGLMKQISFFYTGSPILSFPTLTKIDTVTSIGDGAYQDVMFIIADTIGNPVAAGNTVTVTVTGAGASDIVLSQDVNTVTDGIRTNFAFRATDARADAGAGGELSFQIKVAGVTGNVSRTLHGVLLGVDNITVSPSARQPSKIAWIGATASDISIAGVGALENAVITYEVQDSLGQAIDKSKRVYARYERQFYPNSTVNSNDMPRVIPSADSTNDQGRLFYSVVSGTVAGTFQLVVIINVNGTDIRSSPVRLSVHSGFPDQDHFTLMTSLFTTWYGGRPSFSVAVGDTFSNPVSVGTAVYFHTQSGVIPTGKDNFNAYTDPSGFASVSLLAVNPLPDRAPYCYVPGPTDLYYNEIGGAQPRIGYFWVTAQTQGRFNNYVSANVLILESVPTSNINFVPAIPDPVIIPRGKQSDPISIRIYDANGNPLPAGTTIDVTVDYPATSDGTVKFGVSGDTHSIIPNSGYARFRGPGVTDFSFRVVDQTVGGSSPTQSVIVNVVVKIDANTTFTKSFTATVQ